MGSEGIAAGRTLGGGGADEKIFQAGREDPRARRARYRRPPHCGARPKRALRQNGTDRDVIRFSEALLASRWLEDRAAGIYAAESFVRRFGEAEFRRRERWLRYTSDWATNDGLSVNVLGPQLLADRKRVQRVFCWARSRNRWYRRAAATSLIPAARRGFYATAVFRLARRLYRDSDEMVQKGVGWLLKEASKARPAEVARFLLSVKHDAPRLVLRYACEKLAPGERQRVLT